MLKQDRLVWAVDRFGYEKANRLAKWPFFPGRERWFVHQDGSLIETRTSDGRTHYMGGILDLNYAYDHEFLWNMIEATFGMKQPRLLEKNSELTIIQMLNLLDQKGIPVIVVDLPEQIVSSRFGTS